MAKPKPVPKSVVCSECGLPWADHVIERTTKKGVSGVKTTRREPTPADCIRLLKAELAKRPPAFAYGSNGYTITSPSFWTVTTTG